MIYTAISVIGMGVYVVTDRIVSQCRLQCCQMVVTIYHQPVRLFLPRWQHHHLMIASTIASIIQWQLSLIARDQYGKANLKPGASLLQCTLRRVLALIAVSLCPNPPRPRASPPLHWRSSF